MMSATWLVLVCTLSVLMMKTAKSAKAGKIVRGTRLNDPSMDKFRGDVRVVPIPEGQPSREWSLSLFDQTVLVPALSQPAPAGSEMSTQAEAVPYYSPASTCYESSDSIFGTNLTTCWQASQDVNFYYSRDRSSSSSTSTATISMPAQCITNSNQMVFFNGVFSAEQTFYNCWANVMDSALLPTFYNGSYNGCTFISTVLTLLNLVEIDEISGSAVLQVLVDYSWYDFRYDMPAFWDYVDNTSYSGFDLTSILKNDSIVMWLPEVTFPDAGALSVQSATLTLYYPCRFVYEVVYDLSLVQPLFDFKKYPSDTQNVVIRATVTNYDADQLQMFPAALTCSYIQDGTCSFAHNAIWTWQREENYCTVYYDKKMSLIWPAYVLFTVTLARESSGVVVRFVIPLTLLILLSTLTFWISYESRVDTTITLLLATSALYIVILQNIPMVGYLTSVDKFVFGMFLLLCIIAAMHQVYATMRNKVERWPLRPVYLRCIELLGRCCVPPVVLYYFSTTVQFATAEHGTGVILAATAVSLAIFSREIFGVRAIFLDCMLMLVDKVNQPDIIAKDISAPEAFALNMWMFNDMTFSKLRISRHLQQFGKFEVDTVINVTLKNAFSLNSLLGGHMQSNISSQHAKQPLPLSSAVSIEMTARQSEQQQEQRFNQVAESEIIGTTARGSVSNPLSFQAEHVGQSIAPTAPIRQTLGMFPDSDDEDPDMRV